MHNAVAQRAANITKTFILFVGFSVLLVAVGFVLSNVYGSNGILFAAIGITLVMTAVSYFFSDKIALRASGAKPVTQSEAPELYAMVQRLSSAAQIPMPRLYMTDERQINAFATGRNPKNAAVAVTRGMMEKLSPAEVEAVLAHEISHVTNRDILVSSVAVVLAGVVATGAQFLGNSMIFGGGDEDNRSPLSIILSVALIILAPIGATIMQLAISRRREALADVSGSMLTGKPLDLASALQKIGADATPMLKANDATAHLWISNPFRGKQAMGFLHKLFMTHPPIEERVAALRQIAQK
jgi:heat shock protein HtpX